MKINSESIKKILLKINPKIKPYFKKKTNLITHGLLDSLMIIRLIDEIESKTKKKIKIKNINKDSFSSIENILKILKS